MAEAIKELADQGKKLIRYMRMKNWRVREVNIVYIEDADAETWKPVTGKLDVFDDVRVLVTDDGDVLLSSEATCEPGAHYTYQPMNPRGAFRIQNDVQFLEAWTFGKHHRQDALVQCAAIVGFRDANKDGVRTGDLRVVGPDFAVNQHTCGNSASDDPPPQNKIGPWSAGCLVGRYPVTHYRKFLPILHSFGYTKWDTAIVPSDLFAKWNG